MKAGQERIFVQQYDNHNKYWIVRKGQDQVSAHVRNGRLGAAKGQVQPVKSFGSEWAADSFIESKISEKLLRGYREVTSQQFHLLSTQAALLGLNNKASIEWVEKVGSGYRVVEPSRLVSPDYTPALRVRLMTRDKEGYRDYRLLMDLEGCRELESGLPVGPGHPLEEFIQKVQAAVGAMVG